MTGKEKERFVESSKEQAIQTLLQIASGDKSSVDQQLRACELICIYFGSSQSKRSKK